MNKIQSVKTIFTWFLRIVIFSASVIYVYNKLHPNRDEFSIILNKLYHVSFPLFFVVVLLLFANWSLETVKWRYLVRKIIPDLGFREAFSAVLAGIAAGLFTPNRVGDYVGRIFYLSPFRRLEVLLMTFLDRMCQMIITVFFGSFAISFFIYRYYDLPDYGMTGVIFLCVLLNALIFLLILYPRQTMNILIALLPSERIRRYLRLLLYFSSRDMIRVLFYSFLRYCVFCTQYLILLYIFGAENFPLSSLLLAISSVFLVKSIIPTLALAELGIREAVAIAFFSAMQMSPAIAFQATFSLYLVNIILPGLIGLLFVPFLRFFNSSK